MKGFVCRACFFNNNSTTDFHNSVFDKLSGTAKPSSTIPYQNMMHDEVQHNYRVLTDRNQFEAC